MLDPSSFAKDLPRTRFVFDRVGWVCNRCSGREVLHIGCADAGLIAYRERNNYLLQKRLEEIADTVVGIDVDPDAVKVLSDRGHEHVYVADIASDPKAVLALVVRDCASLDVIVCGEVVEHVLCPESFLRGVRYVASLCKAKVIITVPNAFSIRGILSVYGGREIIHPDHKYYFSCGTLTTLLEQTGFEIEELLFYSNPAEGDGFRRGLKSLMARTIWAWKPQLGEGIIAVARSRE